MKYVIEIFETPELLQNWITYVLEKEAGHEVPTPEKPRYAFRYQQGHWGSASVADVATCFDSQNNADDNVKDFLSVCPRWFARVVPVEELETFHPVEGQPNLMRSPKTGRVVGVPRPINGDTTVPSALRNHKSGAPDALRVALREHLVSILQGELTPRMLLELEQAAGLAHKMLIVSGDQRAIRHARNGIGGGYGLGPSAADVLGPFDLDPPSPGGIPSLNPGFGIDGGGPLAPAALGMGENFGAEALRNLIAGFNQPKLGDILRSLESAEALEADNPGKYTHLVEKLRAQADAHLKEDNTPEVHT